MISKSFRSFVEKFCLQDANAEDAHDLNLLLEGFPETRKWRQGKDQNYQVGQDIDRCKDSTSNTQPEAMVLDRRIPI